MSSIQSQDVSLQIRIVQELIKIKPIIPPSIGGIVYRLTEVDVKGGGLMCDRCDMFITERYYFLEAERSGVKMYRFHKECATKPL